MKRNSEEDFIKSIKEIQNKASERGLTQEKLNDILNEPLSDKEIVEFQSRKTKYYAERILSEADKIRVQKGLSNEDMDKRLDT
jgi:hypothetical protein